MSKDAERKAYNAAKQKQYREEKKAKMYTQTENVHADVHAESVQNDDVHENVHAQPKVDKAMTYEKQPTVFPGVFTLKPVEVNVIESDWHPSEVERHDIKQCIFTSSGVPTKAPDGKVYVLVSGSIDTNLDGEIEPFSVIAHEDWKDGLERTCMHGLAGWSCKQC